MLTFADRLATFKSWPKNYGNVTPENLAIAGFICQLSPEDELVARCIYCEKVLEGWESTDIPINEHFSHRKTCPLFNMNLTKNRLLTFEVHDKQSDYKKIAENGFIRYDLGDMPFIFCFMCGSIDKNHKCEFKIRTAKFSLTNENLFFYKLIQGKYNDSILKALDTNVYIPSQFHEQLKFILEDMSNNGILCNYGDIVELYINKQIKMIENTLDEDIKKVLELVEKEASKKSLTGK